MSVFETARNLLIHYLLSDAMFYWFHRACHQNLTYARIHSQHHSHKATKGAEMKMNALSGTCVDFWDMVIIGHLPVFLPCLFVSLPYAVMICYVLFCNFWISMIHSVGSRIDSAPSGVSLLGWGIFVTPRNHARHHMYGRKNVNFTVFLSLWDHAMGTYEGDDITVVKDVKVCRLPAERFGCSQAGSVIIFPGWLGSGVAVFSVPSKEVAVKGARYSKSQGMKTSPPHCFEQLQ
ncbi:unnamed protein product [Polarella glacialis]|uniref:Fatty acid hydroxylase domain-containing protein n=1 Tax=Polarella glacialis TaxID=89957 RepID=A0A813F7V2_POLGL|nr:unnamed protein product [Polarella glacialis]